MNSMFDLMDILGCKHGREITRIVEDCRIDDMQG